MEEEVLKNRKKQRGSNRYKSDQAPGVHKQSTETTASRLTPARLQREVEMLPSLKFDGTTPIPSISIQTAQQEK